MFKFIDDLLAEMKPTKELGKEHFYEYIERGNQLNGRKLC